MKKIIILLITVLIAFFAAPQAEAQFIKNLGKKAVERAKERSKRKVEDKVNEKVDKTVDKVFDTGEDIITGKEEEETEETVKEKSKKEASPASSSTPKAKTEEAPQTGKDIEMAYAKNDFVPGDEIIFDDDVSLEQIGEFPSKWDLREGVAEVIVIDGAKCINLQNSTIIAPLMKEPYNYLPDVFTVELDMFIYGNERIKGNHNYWIRFWSDGKAAQDAFRICLSPSRYDDELDIDWTWYLPSGEESRHGELTIDSKKELFRHISISFNKRALKVYVDGTRVANVPNARKPDWFYIQGDYHDCDNAYFIKNVRIAKGAVPLYDRMMTDGKFITYGITFDVGKSTIKPESMGEINRIVQLMTENPDLKFSVEGHTDSTGNAASNQTLSEARSKAIVDKLVEMGIAADRLAASGKGQTSPIADNGTDEGRAKNRRVEFVKQ